MRRLLAICLGLMIPLWVSPGAVSANPFSPSPAPVASDSLRVIRVSDGDTIVVRPLYGGGKKERVRLLDIDTPERGEEFSKEARKALAALVGRGPVRLAYRRPGVPQRDKYGRLLAYVLVNRVNVNIEMVRSGWSRFYSRHGQGNFPTEFRRAEAEARAAKRGIWGKSSGR
jgi:micrococcal nuclease